MNGCYCILGKIFGSNYFSLNVFDFQKDNFIKIVVNENYIINNNNKINLQYFKLHYLDKLNKS